ncbi:DUF4124 domain-containing protein [Massilia sp. CF038]|uniref:DUF4124 domain-containing protein n=1 Tax=Massilia sp. CF038 TaxID=1881045 RepID=UPI0015B6AB9D|nr:DUF4124 domain-containing protein [Massilia sp. CF038]
MSTQTRPSLCLFAAVLCLAAFASPAHAELYKWVDANGKIHYSDRADAGKAKVDTLVTGPKSAPPAAISATPDWQQQEAASRKRREQEQADAAKARAQAPARSRPHEGYRNGKPETDDSRCRLARDVLSGAARHSGGAPTDRNDIEVAQRDVQAFCK